MRKFTFLVLFTILSITAFSQIKHNKFTTGIKFAQFNPGFQFSGTSVTEIKNQGGYFLSNHYDDQVGGFHPSLVRLDIDGNIVFDSIYEFTPNNSNGGTQLIDAVNNLTSHTVLYATESMAQPSLIISGPYLVNSDLNGNLNWHVGMVDDTFDLEPTKVIHTQDGGYAIIGMMEDKVLGVHKTAGMIIKLDNSGALQWDSVYRSTDTLSYEFDNAVETPDGGILVVGTSPRYHNNTETPLLLAKMNSTGSIVWSKVMKLATPIDHTFNPDEISVGMLNLTDAFVSYEVYDTAGGTFRRPVITSVNTFTGVNNWTKVYTFPGEAELARATSDRNGNIVVQAMDTINQPVIFRFDDSGNFLGAKSFMRVLPAPYNHFPFEIKPTIDGGFIHVNGIDPNDVLVVKTDKDLEPSCDAIDSMYAHTLVPSLNIDTSYFGILDSTFSIPYLNLVTLPGGTPFNTVADDSLVCSCNNSIQGTVMQGGVTPVNNAKVYLFRKGVVPKPWTPVDSTTTDAAGFYQFNYVATDSFLVRVEADTTLFPGALTSYFKEPQWCYRWDLAGVIATHCDSGVVIKDVKLVVPPALTGNSTLGGYIYESFGSFSKGNMQPGDPIPGIDITVDQSPSGIAGGSTSQTNGYYSLTGLDTNKTYIVTIDFPGLPHDSVWTININLNDTTLDSLNFYIDSTGIYILNQPFGTGVTSIKTDIKGIDVYPNPTLGLFTLEVAALKPEEIHIQLVDRFGKNLLNKIQHIKEGNNKIVIDETSDLPPGLYFLKVKEGSSMYIKKIVKM